MKFIVLGASGFIGFPIAQALTRAGHIVYGLTRSEAKAKQLAAEEIIPIIGQPESDSWHSLISTADVIIEALGGDSRAISPAILETVSKVASSTRPKTGPKVSYIYTSGTWVHGENRKDIVTDTTPITSPITLTSWRPAVEQLVVGNPVLNGIVIRPSLLYGKSGSLLAPLFESAAKGKVAWYGTPGGRYATIHTDDLADLYVKAAEKAPLLGGLIFDGTNEVTESVDDFLQKLVEVSGAQGPYEYLKPSNLFETALGTTSLIRPYLARSLLGWAPRKASLVDGLEVYYAAYLASRGN